ncbi:DUF551 domain-containing protein [Klebsiella pneumoniae]|nr:DUF551 domain-containing protein [Klebsiella pneumoniae]
MARMVLAAMDSEPVALQPELEKVIYHFRDWNEGFPVERFKADYVISWMLANYPPAQPVPVVSADLLHTAASAIEDLLTTKDRTGACVWFDLPFRLRSAANAQPAPVVHGEVARAIEELKRTLVDCNRYNYCSDAVARVEVACRAAMLHAGNSPAQSDCCPAQNHVSPEQNGDAPAQSQGWIQVSERMPEAEGHYLVWTNASRIDGYCDHLAIATYQGGGWSNEFNWLVTHWMPLPAGPQEVNYG